MRVALSKEALKSPFALLTTVVGAGTGYIGAAPLITAIGWTATGVMRFLVGAGIAFVVGLLYWAAVTALSGKISGNRS